MQDNKNAATFWITVEGIRMQESRSWPRQTNKMAEAQHNASKHYLFTQYKNVNIANFILALPTEIK